MIKKPLCIYHFPCADGFGSAFATWLKHGHDFDYHPANYGEPIPDVDDRKVYIFDFSYPLDEMNVIIKRADSVAVRDHHKTAEEALGGLAVKHKDNPLVDIVFDVNKSGAVLTWEYWFPNDDVPEMFRLIEDRDLWNFKYQDTKAFARILWSHPYDFETWSSIYNHMENTALRDAIIHEGEALLRAHEQTCAELIKDLTRIEVVAGHHDVPVLNLPIQFGSDVCHLLLKAHPDAPFAAYYFDKPGPDGTLIRQWGARSEDSRIDVGQVAKEFGGGGHRNASGWREAIR